MSAGRDFSGLVFLFTLLVLSFGEAQAQAPATDPKIANIERLLEIHYLRQEFKSPADVILIRNSELLLRVWKDLPLDPTSDRVECSGYQWLITGRGQKLGQGAAAVFEKYTDITSIQLEFVEMEFKMKSIDGRGSLKREEIMKPYLKMSLNRSSGIKTEPGIRKQKREMRENLSKCLEIGRRWIQKKEINL